jgi:very-short-patch-repair endonuclease
MNNKSTTIAQKLRNNPTEAEKRLWQHLKHKQMDGLKFRRQQPIGDYIVDFINFEKMVVVEVDGGQHMENQNDIERDNWLHQNGFIVLRFWNNDVLKNTEGVVEVIKQICSPFPHPSLQGRGIEKHG